jgi:hypothetical protein
MTRYVIGPDVAIRLAHDQAVIRGGHQILAPALLRSQVLSLLYQAARRGEMTRKEAERQLEYVRGLRIRLLGDRVLQNVAWKAAVLLGWPDTFRCRVRRTDPAPRRRADHPRPANRRCREGSGDGRTYRGPVLTQAGLTSGTATRTYSSACRNEGVASARTLCTAVHNLASFSRRAYVAAQLPRSLFIETHRARSPNNCSFLQASVPRVSTPRTATYGPPGHPAVHGMQKV